MLRDLATWLLYSPRRLIAVAVPVALVGVLGLNDLDKQDALNRGDEQHFSRMTTPAPVVADPSPGDESEHREVPTPEHVIREAALEFLRHYVVAPEGTPSAIPPKLEQVTTPALRKGLLLTDPALLPHGEVMTVDVQSASAFHGLVVAVLVGGTRLEVSVVAWDDGWRVSDVRLGDES